MTTGIDWIKLVADMESRLHKNSFASCLREIKSRARGMNTPTAFCLNYFWDVSVSPISPSGTEWILKLDRSRLNTLLIISHMNYSRREFINGYGTNHPDTCPTGHNRRYEVMYIRFLIQQLATERQVFVAIRKNPYKTAHPSVSNANTGATQIWYARNSPGFKPITKAGFKRLCVDRTLVCVWKASEVKTPCVSA